MKNSIWFILFCIWFGLLMGGVARGSDTVGAPVTVTVAESSQKISCDEFFYFRESCGELVKLLTQDAVSQAHALKVSGNTTSL